MRAYNAFHLFCGKPIELMSLLDIFLIQIFCIIMAKTTSKKFLALLTLLHACSFIVSTPMLHHLIFLLCSIIITFVFFSLFALRRLFLFLNLFLTFFVFNYFIFSGLLLIVFPSVFDINLNLITPIFLLFIRLLLTLRRILSLGWVLLILILLLFIVFVSSFVIIYNNNIMLIELSTSIESRKVECSCEIVTH